MNEEIKTEIPATPLEPAIPTGKPPHPPVPPCPPPFPPDPFPPSKPMPPCPPPVSHRTHGGRFCTPPWFNPAPKPPIPPEGYTLPELTPYTPGMTVEAQINYLYNNVNSLIEVFNQCNEKMFGAYEAVVNSAACNDAYYGEITTEEGYMGEGPNTCSYKISHIPFIDRAGQPIYLELGLPYNSTINDGAAENCYSASIRTLADKLIPATQSGEEWKGFVIWKGKPVNKPQPPIIKADDTSYYLMGVTENGYIKWYPSTVSMRTLNVDKVRNCMNCNAILINNGEITPDLFSPVGNQLLARAAVGMNYKTKERFIIVVEGSEQTGCTEQQLAELFYRYGCDVAVQTAYGTSAFGMDKGMMEFMPATIDNDSYPTMPDVSGFWYITKRRNYHNELVREIAELTQRMGEQIWYDWINADSVDYVKSRIVEVVKMIEDESINRENADTDLRARIDALNAADIDHVENVPLSVSKDAWYIFLKSGEKVNEPIITYNYDRLVSQLQTYDNFETSLTEEVEARKEADDVLRGMIDSTINDLNAEIADRKAGDDELRAMFTDPNSAIMQLIRQVESTLQTNIDTETTARINADNAIRALLTAEQEARIAGDQTLADNLNNFRAEYTLFVGSTNTSITTLTDSLDTLRTNINTEITDIKSRLTAAEGDIDTLQNSYNELTNRVTALNAAVTALQSAFNTLETSFDNIKEAFATIQQSFVELSNKVDELTTQLGSVEDDIKAKIEDGPWLERVNIGAPDGTLSRTMRPDINGVFFSMPGTDGQPDSLSEVKVANPTTESSAVPYGYHEESIANAIADAHNYTDQEVTKMGNSANQYTDTSFEVLNDKISDIIHDQGDYMPKSGGEFTGMVSLAQAPMTGINIANKAYVDEQIANVDVSDQLENYMPKSGGEFTGMVSLAQAPMTGVNIANKAYVDEQVANVDVSDQLENYLPLAGGTLSGNLNFKNGLNNNSYNAIFEVDDPQEGVDTPIVGMRAYKNTASGPHVMKVFSNGDESGETIINGVANPAGPNDAVNKRYLEQYINADMEVEWDDRVVLYSSQEATSYDSTFTPDRDGIVTIVVRGGAQTSTIVVVLRDIETQDDIINIETARDNSTGSTEVRKGKQYLIHIDNTANISAIVLITFAPFKKLSVAIEENSSVNKGWGNKKTIVKTMAELTTYQYVFNSDGIASFFFDSKSQTKAEVKILINNIKVGLISSIDTFDNTATISVRANDIMSFIPNFSSDSFAIEMQYSPFDLKLLAKLGNYMPITGGTFEGPVRYSPTPSDINYLPALNQDLFAAKYVTLPNDVVLFHGNVINIVCLLSYPDIHISATIVDSTGFLIASGVAGQFLAFNDVSGLMSMTVIGEGEHSTVNINYIRLDLRLNADMLLYVCKNNTLNGYTTGAGGIS